MEAFSLSRKMQNTVQQPTCRENVFSIMFEKDAKLLFTLMVRASLSQEAKVANNLMELDSGYSLEKQKCFFSPYAISQN